MGQIRNLSFRNAHCHVYLHVGSVAGLHIEVLLFLLGKVTVVFQVRYFCLNKVSYFEVCGFSPPLLFISFLLFVLKLNVGMYHVVHRLLKLRPIGVALCVR